MNQQSPRIACFVSSHGFGHATRMAAILDSLHKSLPNVYFEIYGETPKWFWQQNLRHQINFQCIQLETDIGLLQVDPFNHDIERTCHSLRNYLNFSSDSFLKARKRVARSNIDLILCDISPMGIVIGEQLKIPSMLIENFTWDWIYEDFLEGNPIFRCYCLRLKEIFEKATVRIQCTPYCKPYPGSIKVNPIYRHCRKSIDQIKSSLGLSAGQHFLLITTGGTSLNKNFTNNFTSNTPTVFATNQPSIRQKENLISIPMNSDFHFPDIVRASACVIGKAGYGTICECWGSSTPLQAVYRENFKESKILKSFAKLNLKHREISITDFLNKKWDENFLQNPKNEKKPALLENGSDQVGHTILNFLKL